MDYLPRLDEHAYPAAVTRLVVLGDPHGSLAGLAGVLEREAGPGVAFVSAGDNLGYADGPTSAELCRRLEALGARSVYGNHEAWMAEDGRLSVASYAALERRHLTPEALAWCAALPQRLRLSWAAAPGLRVVVRHTLGEGWDYVGTGNAHLLAGDEGVDLVFVGHSHGAAVHAVGPEETCSRRLALDGEEERLEVPLSPGVPLVVDAGSLAIPGYHPEPPRPDLATYAALDLVERRVELRAFPKATSAPS